MMGKRTATKGCKRKGLQSAVSSSSLVFASNGQSPFREAPGTERKIPAAGGGQEVTSRRVRCKIKAGARDNAYNEEHKKGEQKRDASPTWPGPARPTPRKAGFKEKELKEKSLQPHHSPQGALNKPHPTLEPSYTKSS